MKKLLSEFMEDSKDMARQNPGKVGALVAVSFAIGWLFG